MDWLTVFATDVVSAFNHVVGQQYYWVFCALLIISLYMIVAHENLVRKLIGLNIMQASVFLLYISLAYVHNSTAPILMEGATAYASPLPHVLILTAIVVGISTTAVGLTLIIRIHASYGTLNESELADQNIAQDAEKPDTL